MKKISLILMLFVVVPSIVFSVGFRQTTWGMSETAIRAMEGDSGGGSGSPNTTLLYEKFVYGMDCKIFYTIINSRLMRVKYEVKTDGKSYNWCVTSFNNLKDHLSQKYGTPQNMGVFSYQWNTYDTVIELRLSKFTIGNETLLDLSVEFLEK